jgi:hypothetical protein
MDQRRKIRLARKGCLPKRKNRPNLFQKIIRMEMQRLHKPAKSPRKQARGFGVLVWRRNAAHKDILQGQSQTKVTGRPESLRRGATLRAYPFEPLTSSAYLKQADRNRLGYPQSSAIGQSDPGIHPHLFEGLGHDDGAGYRHDPAGHQALPRRPAHQAFIQAAWIFGPSMPAFIGRSKSGTVAFKGSRSPLTWLRSAK